uniref:Uncharacterized protein n=1 Tax=Anguilla anguilla TaxID=7936 RepID=A0A0E9QKU4_ANGAN
MRGLMSASRVALYGLLPILVDVDVSLASVAFINTISGVGFV